VKAGRGLPFVAQVRAEAMARCSCFSRLPACKDSFPGRQRKGRRGGISPYRPLPTGLRIPVALCFREVEGKEIMCTGHGQSQSGARRDRLRVFSDTFVRSRKAQLNTFLIPFSSSLVRRLKTAGLDATYLILPVSSSPSLSIRPLAGGAGSGACLQNV
jgi:hypothetical protein